MPERDDDPIASTQMFRAFVQRGEPEPAGRRSRTATIAVSLTVAAVVAAAVVVWLLVR
jgi:hypothetical protein